MSSHQDVLSWGREALKIEAEAILNAASRLGRSFEEAVALFLKCEGKVVVCGLGKSGHIGRKISSTLASTGTPSCYLHPTEALHGDLGILDRKDVLVCIAFGGQTPEVLEVARFARRREIPVVSITGNSQSPLSSLSDVLLDGSVSKEACPLNLAPTSSSTLALALGDALSVAVMKARGFREPDFAQYHPSGSLGRRLMKVEEVMVPREELAVISSSDDFHTVLAGVTRGNFGIAAVCEGDRLLGVITDGDIRRTFLNHGAQSLQLKASDLMSKKPRTILRSALALDAMSKMEGMCTALMVCTADYKLEGLVRMHDLLAAKIV